MLRPAFTTPLLGRERECAEVTDSIARSGVTTLVGPGGVGKTRLAHAIAQAHAGTVWFCELASCTDALGVTSAVAERLGIVLGRGPDAALGRFMARQGPALLVLDNCERLTQVVAALSAGWLEQAADLRVLATSRQSLGVRDEARHEIAPLALPIPGRPPDEAPAFQLFVNRLRAAGGAVEPADLDPALVGALLQATEGIPLAIELAAGRVPLLGVRGIVERLSRRLDLFGSQQQRAAERQASLRASVRWSWEVLSDAEQRALACFAVFRGGFPIGAAEARYGAAGIEIVETLCDRSLLRVVRPGRFCLYDAVREFALEQLDARSERHAAAEFQAGWTATFCASAADGARALAALTEERSNIEQALQWTLLTERAELACTAMLALGRVLSAQGPAAHHLQLLTRTLALAPEAPALLHARGKLLQTLGHQAEAERDLTAAQARCGDNLLGAEVTKDLAVLQHQRRQIEGARTGYESAMQRAKGRAGERMRAVCIANLGALDHDVGEYGAARERYGKALAVLRRLNDLRTQGVVLTNLAILEQELGRSDKARRHYERALELSRTSGDRHAEAIALENLAVLCDLAGDLAHSAALHVQARALLQALGDERSEALCRARLSSVLAQQGALREASAELEQAEALLDALDDTLAARLLPLHRGILELIEGDRAAAMHQLRQARRVQDGVRLVDVSDDARTAVQILERLLARGTSQMLTVRGAGHSFQLARGPLRDLSANPSLARILAFLARQHAHAEEQGASVEHLFAAGWPNQRIAAESAANRVHVALARLRKLGLDAVLERTDDGHRLSPDWLVISKPAKPAPE